MAIRLPRDASGHVIPLDTTMMYRDDNSQFHVTDFFYEAKPDRWFARNGSMCVETSRLYLDASEKDSWEKLEEDLDRCIEKSNSCAYFSPEYNCRKCARPDSDTCGCTVSIFKSIKKRIRKLRGEDE